MTHKLDYFATRVKALNEELNNKRDNALKLDRQLVEANDEIDALKAQLSELEQQAADNGHAVADVHEAAAAIEDRPKGKK